MIQVSYFFHSPCRNQPKFRLVKSNLQVIAWMRRVAVTDLKRLPNPNLDSARRGAIIKIIIFNYFSFFMANDVNPNLDSHLHPRPLVTQSKFGQRAFPIQIWISSILGRWSHSRNLGHVLFQSNFGFTSPSPLSCHTTQIWSTCFSNPNLDSQLHPRPPFTRRKFAPRAFIPLFWAFIQPFLIPLCPLNHFLSETGEKHQKIFGNVGYFCYLCIDN